MHTFTATARIPDDGQGLYFEVPAEVYQALGGVGRIYVRGTIDGTAFRHSVLRYAGMLLMTLPKALREATGVEPGDVVEVRLERDTDGGPTQAKGTLK